MAHPNSPWTGPEEVPGQPPGRAATGETLVYEDVLGTNAAFMFRRLDAATLQAGNRYFIQYIGATATIQSPENTCRTSPSAPSGRSTSRTTEPRPTPSGYSVSPNPGGENPELAASRLLTSIIDN